MILDWKSWTWGNQLKYLFSKLFTRYISWGGKLIFHSLAIFLRNNEVISAKMDEECLRVISLNKVKWAGRSIWCGWHLMDSPKFLVQFSFCIDQKYSSTQKRKKATNNKCENEDYEYKHKHIYKHKCKYKYIYKYKYKCKYKYKYTCKYKYLTERINYNTPTNKTAIILKTEIKTDIPNNYKKRERYFYKYE